MRYIGETKPGGWNAGAKLMFLLDLREFGSFDRLAFLIRSSNRRETRFLFSCA